MEILYIKTLISAVNEAHAPDANFHWKFYLKTLQENCDVDSLLLCGYYERALASLGYPRSILFQ